MIYDTFLFYNELDVLDIRLHELDKVVDKFVLVEATVTHTNRPKPLYYQQNKSRFKKFHKKIIHIIVEDSPDVSMPWIIERHQLSAVTRGLRKCKPNDTILYSCADEIPNPEKILEWKDKPGKNKVFLQTMSFYFLNCIEYKDKEWSGSRMFKYKDLLSFDDIYFTRYMKPDIKIHSGGWHFSYMGGVKKIQQKLAAFAHQEFNNDKFNTPEKILKAIYQNKDFLNHGLKFKITTDLSFLPKYVLDNKEKYKDWIVERKKGTEALVPLFVVFLEAKGKLRTIYRAFRRVYSDWQK